MVCCVVASVETRTLKCGFSRFSKSRWTPLHHAAAKGHLPVVQALVGRGADLEAETEVRKAWQICHGGTRSTSVLLLAGRSSSQSGSAASPE